MSLNVYLRGAQSETPGTGIFVRENGSIRELTRAEWDERFPGQEPIVAEYDDDDGYYSANITHNLGQMAAEAGIYKALWRPEEIDITTAAQLIQPLSDGLALLEADPARFKAFNPPNGWGDYDGLVTFVRDYLRACKAWPAAIVEVSR